MGCDREQPEGALLPHHQGRPQALAEEAGAWKQMAEIIERVLERGSWEHVRWLFAVYGEGPVADWVRQHGFRLLSRRSFALWRLALGITDYAASDWAVQAREEEPW
jgi:hypothetical protein